MTSEMKEFAEAFRFGAVADFGILRCAWYVNGHGHHKSRITTQNLVTKQVSCGFSRRNVSDIILLFNFVTSEIPETPAIAMWALTFSTNSSNFNHKELEV